MSKHENALTPWTPAPSLLLSATEPAELVAIACRGLSSRDRKSIVSAFASESYEMVSAFIWSKAAAVLKKQIAKLGMEFVGEMLRRPDLSEDSDPSTSIGDHDAIALAEDLGIINATEGMRLKHSLELVAHFAKLDQEEAEGVAMQREEAVSLLKTCMTAIFTQPDLEAAVKFADFRTALTERTFKPNDGDIEAVAGSPYFFKRITIGAVLAVVKAGKGAAKEHAIGNLNVLLPRIWADLRQPERWQVGQAYADANDSGDRSASTGLKTALLKVRGFDFVPETLRSSTFSEAAARVLLAHFGYNNYYNEPEPMSVLARLGSTVPRPAFPKCMEATLAVRLGNPWGHSTAAQPYAKEVLNGLRAEQWEYYLNQCLRGDRTVLDKLRSQDRPIQCWIALVKEFDLDKQEITEPTVRKLILASASGNSDRLRSAADKLRKDILE